VVTLARNPQISEGSAGQAVKSRRVEATVEVRAPSDAYRPHLRLYDVQALYRNDILDGRVAVVQGKLKNMGSQTLGRVQVTAYFLDHMGARIYEEDFCPVCEGGLNVGDDTHEPLKPGYIRSFAFKAVGCPREWKPGAVECGITQVEFAE